MVTSISVPSFTIFDSMAITSTPLNTNININSNNSSNINSNINNENNPTEILNSNRKRDSNSNTVSETKKLKISQQVLFYIHLVHYVIVIINNRKEKCVEHRKESYMMLRYYKMMK
jgi:hypothetical protein